jgi:two-component system, chemotaxis family, response regulator Rcp1
VSGAKPIEILLVEDNSEDVFLTKEVFREAGMANDLHVALDGEEAMRFLHHEEPFEAAPTPDLVLLDLNLPKKDGREVLAEIKQDPELRRIPVIVLTTSAAERDLRDAYGHHANAYVRKPVGFTGLMEVAKAIESFWIGVVSLPPRTAILEPGFSYQT